MNFLAHSFLSFSDGQIVGNMIADYVHNKEIKNLPEEIQNGIFLHRQIDTFTDAHPQTHEAKKVFSPLVRLYAGAFTDVAMDYFLANDPKIYSKDQWKAHAQKIYQCLEKHHEFLPETFARFLPYMKREDWLYNYRTDDGISHGLQNVLYKAKYLEKDIPVFKAFLENKAILKQCYERFFPDLQDFAQKTAEGWSERKS